MASSTQNLEDLTVVWLDIDQIHTTRDDYLDTKTRLRECHNYIEMYNNTEECIKGIIANENVLLIVPGSICETFIPSIFEMKQILFIYIVHSTSESRNTYQLNCTSKLRGEFSDKSQLIMKLRQDLKLLLKSLTPICIINDKSIRALDIEYTMFMWTQLLTDVLLQIPQSGRGKMMMLNDCRLHYAGNTKQLKMIDDFEKEYEPDYAVWWYTRDSFLYKQLNKALRTQDIGMMFKYRFFITDLYVQLNELYTENISVLDETLVVYRGQTISSDQLEKIKNNVNNLISMNTYLSTTRKKCLALVYAGNGSDRPQFESVLFEITIDKDIATKGKPFGDITLMSAFGSDEEEVLLSMGFIFKIQSIEQLSVDGIVWEVKLRLSEPVVNKEIDLLFNYLKTNSTTSVSNIGTLGLLLGQMGEYKKAKTFYQMMLNELPKDHHGIPIIISNLGILYSDIGDHEKALKYYRKAYDIYRIQKLPEDDLLFAALYHNMGSAFYKNEEKSNALEYFNRAFNICRNNTSLPSLLLTATLHTDMSGVLEDDEDFDSALNNLQLTLEIQLKILPSNHFRIAATYNNIGGIYLRKGDYKTALGKFATALGIGLQSLPNNHEHIQTYNEHINLAKQRIQ